MKLSGVRTLAFFVILIYCFVFVPPVLGVDNNVDHIKEGTVRITDERGTLITMTARKVFEGDEIITAAGYHYRVIFVEKNNAHAKLLGHDKDYLAWAEYFSNNETIAVTAANWSNRPVGVYHTHSGESYVPSDGKASIPFQGGIYQVGDKFVKTLRDNKVEVKYYKTPHDPHDSNAYTRSRRTAMGLLKSNPVALFDVHRDGVPDPEFFTKEVSGENIAQLRLVVGQQNPKMKSNLDFARRIMAYANKKHPGVVKEIYRAHGNYNQDLISTAILLEAGTYTNTKEIAENGVELLAEAIPVVLGVENHGGGITDKEASETGWNVAFWLTMVTLLAGTAFVILNFGWQETVNRIKGFGNRFVESSIWAGVVQAFRRVTEYVQRPLADNLPSIIEKLKNIIRRKNKL